VDCKWIAILGYVITLYANLKVGIKFMLPKKKSTDFNHANIAKL